ncbi:MAG: hypothetical protein ACO1PW_07695 [Actinomycetota bacterium]
MLTTDLPASTARSPVAAAAAACVAVAVASLALPATLAYDPWAWLVWGREVGRGALDTTGGPSWKPLPVLVTTALAPLGSTLAVAAWMVVARFAGLMALVGAHRLARRLGASAGAALAAGALVVLTPDGGPRFLRLVAEGHAEPATAALALFALERALAGRRLASFGLLMALSLLRPEAWPFLLAAAAWVWIRDPDQRRLVVIALAAVPVLWFGADWWGSGSPLHGAGTAQVVADEPFGDRLQLALERAWRSVSLPVWPAAAIAVASAGRRREPRVLAVAAAALGWMLVVVGMAGVLGYAALSRFFLPSAALLCVLAVLAVGAVGRALGRLPSRTLARAAAGVLLAACGPSLAARIGSLGELAGEVRDRHALAVEQDAAVADAGGRGDLVGCRPVALDTTGEAGPMRPALAWRLDLPLHEIERPGRDDVVTTFAQRGSSVDRGLADRGERPLAMSVSWVVWSRCTSPSTGR